MRDLVIIGARSHAREVADAVAAINAVAPTWNLLGFVDHGGSQPERIAPLGRILGTFEDHRTWEALPVGSTWYVTGVGAPAARAEIAAPLSGRGYRAATIVHPSAVVGSQVVVGEGCYVAALVALMANARLGSHVHLNVRANVHHDCNVGDFSIVNPGAVLTGNVQLGAGVEVGASAVLIPSVRVGDGAVVGAGTVVIRDVGARAKVVGNPARVIGTA